MTIYRNTPALLVIPFLALLFYLYQQDSLLLQTAGLTPTENPSTNRASQQSSLTKPLPLFGVVAPPPSNPNEMDIESLPETRLELSLVGTFTHADTGQASALIAEEGGRARQIFIGEAIVEDAILVQVQQGYVTLRRNGQDEILKLATYGAPEQSQTNLYTNRAARTSPIAISYEPVPAPVQEKALPEANQTTEQQNPARETLRERLARMRSAGETE